MLTGKVMEEVLYGDALIEKYSKKLTYLLFVPHPTSFRDMLGTL